MKKPGVLLIILLISLFSYGKQYSLLTDLPDSTSAIKSIRMLLNDLEVYHVPEANGKEILKRKEGLVVLFHDVNKVQAYSDLIKKYGREGGTIVMDIKTFARLKGYSTETVDTRTIKVKEESIVTAGYKKGEPIIYSNKGKLTALTGAEKGVKILGGSDRGDVLLVEQKNGSGKIIAYDLLSLSEPAVYADTENKYLFLVNAVGNRVKYGQHYPQKLKYDEFVEMMKNLSVKNPSVKLTEEGEGSGGYKIYSLNMGNPAKPGIFIYSNTHGNEWENAYGTFTFVKYLAEHPDQDIIDLNKFSLKVIPLLNPYGHVNMTRQNGNKVDLNRNGDHGWEKYTGQKPYQPGAYDWKGTAPFSEPESRTLRNAAELGNYIAFIDIHGNPSGTGYNKWMGVAENTKEDAKEKGEQFRDIFNNNIQGRYILKQSREKDVKPIIIESIVDKSPAPNLYNTIAKDKYGYIVEFICGYGNTGHSSMQVDIITELCAAFCRTFAK